jgi:hypothetical protein
MGMWSFTVGEKVVGLNEGMVDGLGEGFAVG